MRLLKFWLGISLILISQQSFALVEIRKIRVWPAPESTRIVFDINQNLKYKVYTLESPDRVILDLVDTKLTTNLKAVSLLNTGIKKIRSGVHNNILRIVLELERKITPKAIILETNKLYGKRLV